jgi:hypothetical protein
MLSDLHRASVTTVSFSVNIPVREKNTTFSQWKRPISDTTEYNDPIANCIAFEPARLMKQTYFKHINYFKHNRLRKEDVWPKRSEQACVHHKHSNCGY